MTGTTIGLSLQGRPIHMYEFTDSSVPDTAKTRVWIHTAVHPSENTAYFVVEGLVDWLPSAQPEPETLLQGAG